MCLNEVKDRYFKKVIFFYNCLKISDLLVLLKLNELYNVYFDVNILVFFVIKFRLYFFFGVFRLMVGGVILFLSVNSVKIVFIELVVFNKCFVIDFVEFINNL